MRLRLVLATITLTALAMSSVLAQGKPSGGGGPKTQAPHPAGQTATPGGGSAGAGHVASGGGVGGGANGPDKGTKGGPPSKGSGQPSQASGHSSNPKSGATKAGGAGTPTTKSGTTATTASTPTPPPNAVSTRIAKNPQQLARVEAMLPAGMTVDQATTGFRNQGQFLAALNASRNQGIPFTDLKNAMTVDGLSLGQAVKQLRPVPPPPATGSGGGTAGTTSGTGTSTSPSTSTSQPKS